jgi:hypothetical protein
VVSDKDIFAVFSLKYGMGEKLMSLVNCAVFKTVEESEVWLRQYTHPENPVYSDDELEEIVEKYENAAQFQPKAEPVIITYPNDEINKKEIPTKESIVEGQKIEANFEELEEENESGLSQIQVFTNFEDLESHIQSIESKYSVNENKSDDSESQK